MSPLGRWRTFAAQQFVRCRIFGGFGVCSAITGGLTATISLNDPDYLRRTDIAVAAYPVIRDKGECRIYALLMIF